MKKDLFNNIPDLLPEELTEVLVESSCVRIERIVSDGHASPDGFWYDQEQNEWVSVLAGSAVLQFDDREVELNCGASILIPAHRRHRVKSTSSEEKTIWLAVFYD